ncbi:MAG: 50S ribosomal protein L11 methyltransferase [Clostridiales bacterium]|nr:50S ribosomal protein L11 methyltransferase [Clostridiales bacterium]
MKFKKITVNCTSETSDTVSYALHEAGSMGEVFEDYINIKQVLDDKRWDYADAGLFNPTDGCTVSGYFTIETAEDIVLKRLAALKDCDFADFSMLSATVEIIDSAEWENEWKKYYKPFNIGKIVIVPEWIEYSPSCGDVKVTLNPGLAFGTGMHETTSMCVDLMQRIPIQDKRVLDFGCGSGILGICALALGAKSVVFADTDEQAITATQYNCGINNITNPEIFCRDVREMTEPADIVVANITADVLIDVMPIIKQALGPCGYAIISGIISDKKQVVLDTYLKAFSLVQQQQKNEWSAFIFKL